MKPSLGIVRDSVDQEAVGEGKGRPIGVAALPSGYHPHSRYHPLGCERVMATAVRATDATTRIRRCDGHLSASECHTA